MIDLFELAPEKYWDFTKKYTSEQKRVEIESAIQSDEYIASLKKDGHYNRFTKQDGEIGMLTRTLSTVTQTYSDKSLHVPHIVELLKDIPDNTVIIGELYYPGKTSAQAGEILQCKSKKAIERQNGEYGFIHYYIHDVWFFNGEDKRDCPYEERIKTVQYIYDTYIKEKNENNYVECAKYASTPTEIRNMLNNAFENDEEGIVMVRKSATVECGARTAWKTIKVKKELQKEIDCFFTGNYKEPAMDYTGKDVENWTYWLNLKTDELVYGKFFEEYEAGRTLIPVTQSYYCGWAGSIEVGLLKDGKVVSLGFLSGLPNEIKERITLPNNEYINRPCVVTGMEFTDDGKIRHPKFVRFRDDLNLEDCTYEKVFGE